MVITRLKFNDCEKTYDEDQNANVCGTAGPILSLFLVPLILVHVLFSIFSYCLLKKLTKNVACVSFEPRSAASMTSEIYVVEEEK